MTKFIIYHRLVSLGIRLFDQGVRGSNPFGRTYPKKAPRLPWPRDRKRADRTPDGQQDGSTTRRRARVGRRRFSGGGPERSGGRAAQPRAIRPGALFHPDTWV